MQLAVQMAGDGAGDADPADQEGGEPGQRQEQADAVELAPERGIRVAHVAQPPAAVGERRLQRGRPVCDRRAVRYQRAVAVPYQGAGLHQAGGLQRCMIHHQPGPERYAGGEPVRLTREHGLHRERRRADPELVADPETEAVQQSLLGHGAAAGHGVIERHAAFEPHAIDQRVRAIHRLELDQRAARAVLKMGHAPHGDDMREDGGVRLKVVRDRLR